MSLFKVTGIQTVENKEVFAFAEKVLNENKGISVHVDGSYISGTFRGKSNNEYEYCYASKSFYEESDAYQVEDAFNKVEQMETVEEVVEETIEEVVEKTNSFLAALLIKEIQFEQSKEELTDQEAFDFEQRSDHLINEQMPFFYKGLKITRIQVSHGLVSGHYFSNTLTCWQRVIIEKLG